MIQDALKVRMLGGFTLEYKGREIILDRNIASKTMQLLQIMLLHTGDGGISKTALIEALYGRKEVENKNGSLNNTLFRLRKQLKNAGLPESNYIIINSGICTWDSQIKVSVDVLEFEQLIIQGKAEKRKEEKAQIWTRAGRLYTGEFLPDMIGEDWVAVENVRFRDMYVTVWKNCVIISKQKSDTKNFTKQHMQQRVFIPLMTGRYGRSTVLSECPDTKKVWKSTKKQSG